VSGQFTRTDVTPNPTGVSIVKNNSSSLFSFSNFNDTFNPVPIALAGLSLTTGNTLDFFAAASLSPSNGSTGLAVTITGSGPTLSGTTSAVTGPNGIAVFPNISISTPGTYTIKAVQPVSATVVSGSFTITP
jgi:hypothetical protein